MSILHILRGIENLRTHQNLYVDVYTNFTYHCQKLQVKI